jgi:hypothetical protein
MVQHIEWNIDTSLLISFSLVIVWYVVELSSSRNQYFGSGLAFYLLGLIGLQLASALKYPSNK